MSRATVEECIDKVPNRFDLVLLAAYRSREISAGSHRTVEDEGEKNPLASLREIAAETQSSGDLRERLIASKQKQIEVDDAEDDAMALLMGADQEDLAGDSYEDENLLRTLMASQNQ